MKQSLFSTDPTAEQHLQGAEANLAFADALRKGSGSDPATVGWAITALFYCAVHTVRAYLVAVKNVRVVSHEQLRPLVRTYPELQRTEATYSSLKQQSESARYYLNPNFTWLDYDELRKDAARILSTWKPKVESAVVVKK